MVPNGGSPSAARPRITGAAVLLFLRGRAIQSACSPRARRRLGVPFPGTGSPAPPPPSRSRNEHGARLRAGALRRASRCPAGQTAGSSWGSERKSSRPTRAPVALPLNCLGSGTYPSRSLSAPLFTCAPLDRAALRQPAQAAWPGAAQAVVLSGAPCPQAWPSWTTDAATISSCVSAPAS